MNGYTTGIWREHYRNLERLNIEEKKQKKREENEKETGGENPL